MASNKGELPKTLLVTLFCEDREEISIISEKWVIDDDEILYPTLVKGAKREKFIRCHQEPDPETWTKYPYSLLKICCEYIFIYSQFVKVFEAVGSDEQLFTFISSLFKFTLLSYIVSLK